MSVLLPSEMILRSRSPLTEQERSEASSAMNLDQPVAAATYRQERARLASEGAENRESVSFVT